MAFADLAAVHPLYTVPEAIHNKYFPTYRLAYIDLAESLARSKSYETEAMKNAAVRDARIAANRKAHNAFEAEYRAKGEAAFIRTEQSAPKKRTKGDSDGTI